MPRVNYRRQILLTLAGLGLVLALESFTDFDFRVQQFFYGPAAGTWLISPAGHQRLRPWFYDGPKALLIAGGLAVLGCFLGSFKKAALKPWRRPAAILFLSLALVPLIMAGAKKYTDVYCPGELTAYGGQAAYQPVLAPADPANAGRSPGRCFPAGHASGGLALMALYFALPSPAARRLGLILGLALGGLMGLYQMLRGEHFLSHTLASALGAWLIILIVARLVNGKEGPQPLSAPTRRVKP
jgi:membrane-associated PAP2 superfamily phosphatase